MKSTHHREPEAARGDRPAADAGTAMPPPSNR